MNLSNTTLLRPTPASATRGLGDLYLKALAFGLLGYVILGRGFAYLGAPPLYMGELLFLAGLVVAARSGCLLSLLTHGSNVLLILLGTWVLLRTFPFLSIHGMDSLRDSVVVVYGMFALIVCALLVQWPDRLGTVFGWMKLLAFWYAPASCFQYLFFKYTAGMLPAVPGTDIPIMMIRGGEVASHLAGATVFALLMFRRVSFVWLILTLLAFGMVAAQSRGGMLAILIPLGLACVLGKRLKALAGVGAVVAGILLIAWVLDLGIPLDDNRSLNVTQLVNNVASVAGESEGSRNLGDNKRWRLMWWDSIIDYTFNGPYFWSGKGFGIGLAEADGFLVGEEVETAILRSPHNVHMTILARSGVPGFLLWVSMLSTWVGSMLWNMWQARRAGDVVWANFFLFIACYALSIIINASFDVAMEGPMLGIWFWVLFGIGVGSAMIFRTARASPATRRRFVLQA